MSVEALVIWPLFAVVVVSATAQTLLYISAGVELRRIRQRDRHQLWRRMLASPLAPRISVLVPAYNESVSVNDSVAGLLALTYPNLEIVVVNDGSSDDTLGQLIAHYELSPVHPIFRRTLETKPIRQLYRSPDDARLVVVDKHNGGKADALNAALNVASGDLVCSIDADTLVSPDALQQLVAPFIANEDTVGVGGTIRLANDAVWVNGRVESLRVPRHPLVGAQAVEYSRSFLIGRLAWNPLGGNLIVSGAFGVFRKSAVLEAGGYEHGSIGEDMELVVRLRRIAYENGRRALVEFSPDPVAYTEAPASLRTLARQRNRWFRGLLGVLSRHRRMILNPRYGSAGMLAMPYFLLVEALAPIIELIGLTVVLISLISGTISLASLTPIAVAYLVGISATYAVVILDEIVFGTYQRSRDRLAIAGLVLFEQIVYRPMTSVWRIWGLGLYLRGRTEWGAQERHGIKTATPRAQPEPAASPSRTPVSSTGGQS